MVEISQSFFYNVQSRYLLSKHKKGKLKALEQCYWELVEQYRAQKRQREAFIYTQKTNTVPLTKAAEALSDVYSLLAKNNVDGVSALLDKAKIEISGVSVLRQKEKGCDLPVKVDAPIVNALIDSEENIIHKPDIINVMPPSPNTTLNIDALVSAGRNLVMSGVLKNEGSGLLKIIDQIVAKQVKYNKTLSQDAYEDLLKFVEEGFEQIISLGEDRYKTSQDERALIELQKLEDLNLPEKSGVVRQLKTDEIRRLFSVVKKQNTISIRLGVVGDQLQIENLFSKLKGQKVEFGLEKELQVETNLLLWRVSLSSGLMLYVVGLPNVKGQENTERDLLFTELNSIILLTEKQTEFTVEEDLTRSAAQILCGSDNVRLHGTIHDSGKNDACSNAWGLIAPLLAAS
ncbi:hypothetical protein MNBD_GAMMA16-142 [hydrothermal vent metagenome]|uniref:Uncharacterized protein n=1 Tax=hydrothermal vent metagenome TaxID=652676 RepID=A0A3B0YZ24_9ZZZZ